MSRRVGREHALQYLFAHEFTNASWENLSLIESPSDFAKELAAGVISNLKEIDSKINKSSKNWKLSRMSLVDRNIIRLGVFEILFLKTEKSVAINEYVEISKIFGDQNSASFINGILDSSSLT